MKTSISNPNLHFLVSWWTSFMIWHVLMKNESWHLILTKKSKFDFLVYSQKLINWLENSSARSGTLHERSGPFKTTIHLHREYCSQNPQMVSFTTSWYPANSFSALYSQTLVHVISITICLCQIFKHSFVSFFQTLVCVSLLNTRSCQLLKHSFESINTYLFLF